MAVTLYLSEAMSIWMPSKSGLEKVSGVRVVRIWLPTVAAAKYWPFESEATTRLLNHWLNCPVFNSRLPAASGSDTVQLNSSQPLVRKRP